MAYDGLHDIAEAIRELERTVAAMRNDLRTWREQDEQIMEKAFEPEQ